MMPVWREPPVMNLETLVNTSVESFPQNVVANAFKFQKAEYFELENEADRAVPSVKF